MKAPLQRPWQNQLVVLAGFLTAGAILPWAYRPACVVALIAIAAVLLVSRLRAHAAFSAKHRSDDVYAKIARIRAARERERPKRGPL